MREKFDVYRMSHYKILHRAGECRVAQNIVI